MARKIDESLVYQLKVTLNGIRPPIWRRVQIRGSTTLYKLHYVLQIAMGWTDSHLHQFVIKGENYGVPTPDWGLHVNNEQRVKVEQLVFAAKDRFVYEYDFGDSWSHQILVEKILPPEEGVRYPRCLAGKLACPPEDVGGVWGYAEFLEAIGDPNHPEHENMVDWIGGPFDSQAFDVEEINQTLKKYL